MRNYVPDKPFGQTWDIERDVAILRTTGGKVDPSRIQAAIVVHLPTRMKST
jgi:hypothetical protein